MQIRFHDPASDFSDGLAVIRAYHDSLLAQGRRLLELVSEIETHGLDAGRANRLVELYAYYQRANVLHHQDEERALFPAVVGRDLLVDGMIERLGLDHEEIEEAWRVLEIDLKAMLMGHSTPPHVGEKADRFEKLQREHLLRENEDFLPLAGDKLSREQRGRIGRVMAAMRRKIR